ncbi:DUF305 domain-containing protein [Nocardia sp. CDC159]|uniref:DUF305 domain-containing protein n=1 Tax=Nocardia pulmonis TaxID=2951408 RepID=A0A9X2IVA1_9NOCA|nr:MULTISPECIES: DUF305 domain-containing protein [Nocardia]MCM6772224.1 DUF305 domain-containing protein [Nocardia pulmonis]MCM6785118.1 DUF305 domain-containing protein [Nocardia sp. CDC159]
MRVLAYLASALILLVIGAALRPLVLPDTTAAPRVLDDTEIGFAQDMTAHHQQAILMVARLDPTVDPAVWRLAQQIDQTQRTEIGTLLGWLRLANASPTARQPMAWMTDPGAAHHDSAIAAQPAPAAMPGMAAMSELDRLAAARGRDAEILFLQLMYRHHQGGITMARAADRAIRAGAVKEAARAMLTAQSQELGLMAVMLNQRGAQPLA